MLSQAEAHIQNIIDHMLWIDGQCSGKIHVMGRVAVDDRRHNHHLVRMARRGAERDLLRQKNIGVERQLGSVLLDDARGHHRDPAFTHHLAQFLPGHVSHQVLGYCHRSSSTIS